MTKIQKVEKFLDFVTDYKLPKLVKRMSDEELVDLYQKYNSLYFTAENNIKNTRNGAMIVYAVVEELRRRHPNNPKFKDYNYQNDLHLF